MITDSHRGRGRRARPACTEQIAVRSIRAGNDIVLTTGRGSWIRVYRALLAEARASRAFRARVKAVRGARGGAPAHPLLGHLSVPKRRLKQDLRAKSPA